MIAPTAMPWSVWCFWDEGWAFRGWYVNLEDPHYRDAVSILTQDHVLDLWVGSDRAVRWKDEDELAAAVVAGRYSDDDAERFREHAQQVERIVQEWESPFCDAWEHWRPSPTWATPNLPGGSAFEYDDVEESP